MDWQMKPYQWRGKVYHTINGLHNAVRKDHPSCGLSFERDYMVVSTRGPDGRTYVYYRRDMETNVIADRPEAS